MPKSKRSKVFHLTQVNKKTREQKEKLFEDIRETVPKYEHCFVLGFDNMRNNHLKDVRRELKDSRLFFGKTKLMSRALGQSPEDATADGIEKLTRYLSGSVALLFTNRAPADVVSYFEGFTPVDFARAGAVATRDFVVPTGVVYATGGAVPAEHDVPIGHTIEPELRKLGIPTRMVRGKVVLGEESGGGEGYTVCKEGQVLDSRQTRLLKLFDQCLSEFKVQTLAYWTAATGLVTEVDAEDVGAMEGVEDEDDE
ncbi:Ribosome assembly factor mrt4 [Cytospora mali]|uniref:Ribosome assembly factor mrt4 n=1 Tax=Cytospora mali TaxID=578113 RepID=A0A194VNV7_CYTMA|nr:Ribosome assembly factor mrt4 [Valsa mali]